jgi:hypothetical protein
MNTPAPFIAEENLAAEKLLYFFAISLVIFLLLAVLFKPEVRKHKLAASCLVLADIAVAAPRYGIAMPLSLLVFPLGIIWFAEILGEIRGSVGRGGIIDTPTPGWMVAGFGWLALLLLSGYLFYNVFAAGGPSH